MVGTAIIMDCKDLNKIQHQNAVAKVNEENTTIRNKARRAGPPKWARRSEGNPPAGRGKK